MKKIGTIFITELRLALRSFDGIFFGLIMPVVILFVVGWIFKGKEAAGEFSMLDQTIGAFAFIGIAAYGLMSLPLVLSNYRSQKILKRLQVTPVSPITLLIIQVAVQASMAIISAFVTLLAAWFVFQIKPSGSVFHILAAYLLGLGSIFSLGLMVASTARNEKKAGIWCSVLYFPMLLLSGTTIPFPVLPDFLQKISIILPLRHGIQMMNGVYNGIHLSKYVMEASILGVIIIAGLGISIATFRWDYDS